MLRRQVGVAVIVLLFAGAISPLSAQVAASNQLSCLEQAARKIRPDSKIILVQPDGKWIKGRFVSVDLGQSLLTLSSLTKPDAMPSVFQISQISKIEYRKAGKLNPLWMGLGLAAGGLGGYLIGKTGSNGSQEIDVAAVSGALGGGIGLSLGTIVPLVIPSTRRIVCK